MDNLYPKFSFFLLNCNNRMTIARKSYGWKRHVPNNNKTRQNYNHVLMYTRERKLLIMR